METSKLKKFAQTARRSLIEQVSVKLDLVLADESAARRESPKAVEELEEQIAGSSRDQVTEKVAYIWFNRFCALRFMDVNGYTSIGIVSPAEGQFQPELLAEARMGHIDEDMVPEKTRQKIFALLDGSASSADPQSEAYRLLLVAACNDFHKAMPYLFERIADYTELLMPDDLLSEGSILTQTREMLTPDTCKDVEAIGWLYQFYISEKKDQVINRRTVVPKEDIPAATQLFTPKWIVEYVVDNSLGHLWMLNRPHSQLFERMAYYIKSEQAETDFLRIEKPEEIRICDPACGSGHMLTYAFDLLHAIYEEEGYEPAEIPEKILTHNLYGIEIDERAGELAAFALTMKARAKQRRFFRRQVQPNICVLDRIKFEKGELKEYMDFVGRDLFTVGLQNTLLQFQEADNFGSLIRPEVTDVHSVRETLEAKDVSSELFLNQTHQKVLQALKQAEYLSQQYHLVVVNPPYAGSRYMNPALRAFAKSSYAKSKTDMFAMFIERSLDLTMSNGQISVVCPYVWMYLSTYEHLRTALLTTGSIRALVRLEYNAFEPACVPVAAWVFQKGEPCEGVFIDLSEFKGHQSQAPNTLKAIQNPSVNYLFRASSSGFRDIPGSPVAYQVGPQFRAIFERLPSLGDACEFTGSQNKTGDNETYVRKHWEVSSRSIGAQKWAHYAKGGGERKWYGLLTDVVDWSSSAQHFYSSNPTSNMLAERYWFRSGITYSELTSKLATFRVMPEGCIYDMAGPGFHPTKVDERIVLLVCNSVVAGNVFRLLNPTLHLQTRDVKNLPLPELSTAQMLKMKSLCDTLVEISREDWDAAEASIDFRYPALICAMQRYSFPSIDAAYSALRSEWRSILQNMIGLETDSNRTLLEAYALRDEFEPDIALADINLLCNPHYRYGSDKSEDELEALLLSDTMKEFISYAVGCMFGRYALEKPGLILANQGETIEDYLKQVPEPSFPADDDNVIPMLDGDWFTDDVTERFFKFLRVTFGEEHYEENLQFIEKAIGKDVRKYFLKDFYSDHVKRYKKRPIYWLFSSPKGSFNALIYLHRYRPDTVSVVLNDYLREFRTKLGARKSHLEQVSVSSSASAGEKTKALKEIEKLNKMIEEMEDYEREELYPLATKQLEIDLDDGVKVNYPKFGKALKAIPGLSDK